MRFLTVLLLSTFLFSASAYADCTDPVGVAGELRWMPEAGTLKWCDGGSWNRLADSRGDGATYYGTGAGLSLGHFLYRGSDWAGFALWDRDGIQATNNDHDAVIFWGDDGDDSLRFAWTGSSGPLTEKMRLTPAGRLGIGTSSPLGTLDVAGNILVSDNAALMGNVYFESATWKYRGNGMGGVLKFPQKSESGGAVITVFPENSSGAGAAAPGVTALRILPNGNVGIGTVAPSYALDVSGSIRAANVIYTSDARLKTNVRPVSGLDTILHLQGVSYDFKADGRHATGVIAQEIEPVMPHAVLTAPDGIKSVDYIQIIAPLIEAVKELKADNDNLRAEIEAMKAERMVGRVKVLHDTSAMRLNE